MIAYRRTRKPSAKFYVFVGGVAAAVFLLIFFLTRMNTVALEWGTIDFETQKQVVLVRDEQVYKAENYGKATFLAS